MADVDRGVSTVLGYTLNIVVATLLVTGLLFAAGSLVDSQREQAVRAELNVIGERVVTNIESADRLSRTTDDGSVAITSTVPDQVAGSGYQIEIEVTGDDAVAVLTVDRPSVTVEVPINNKTAIQPSQHRGGDIVIVWDGSGPMEVHDE